MKYRNREGKAVGASKPTHSERVSFVMPAVRPVQGISPPRYQLVSLSLASLKYEIIHLSSSNYVRSPFTNHLADENLALKLQ